MENKTPEEILKENVNSEFWKYIDNQIYIKEILVESMEEYGKQQYNKAVLDCIEVVDEQYSSEPNESMKKLLKQ